MPCIDPRDAPNFEPSRGELNRLTDLLCQACEALEKNIILTPVSSELVAWCKAHKKADQERAAKIAADTLSAEARVEYWAAEYRKLSPPVPGGEVWLHPDFERIYKNWSQANRDFNAEKNKAKQERAAGLENGQKPKP